MIKDADFENPSNEYQKHIPKSSKLNIDDAFAKFSKNHICLA